MGQCHILHSLTMNLLFVEINECDSSPCANGGTCDNTVNGYECECVARFRGTNCETGIKAQLRDCDCMFENCVCV